MTVWSPKQSSISSGVSKTWRQISKVINWQMRCWLEALGGTCISTLWSAHFIFCTSSCKIWRNYILGQTGKHCSLVILRPHTFLSHTKTQCFYDCSFIPGFFRGNTKTHLVIPACKIQPYMHIIQLKREQKEPEVYYYADAVDSEPLALVVDWKLMLCGVMLWEFFMESMEWWDTDRDALRLLRVPSFSFAISSSLVMSVNSW